jgi:pSer/pThr/pTyr-binding forkhead associated (FHA) protein
VPRKSAEVQAAASAGTAVTPASGAPAYPEGTGTHGTPRPGAPTAKVAARSTGPEPEPPKTTVLLSAAVLTSDAAAGRNEFLLGPLNEIGRAEENNIQIASSNLSRKHAVIRAVPGGFSITDLGSQNGTYVNGERVTERRLADGDTIELGSVRFVFRTPWPVTSHGMPPVGTSARPPSNR